MQISSAFCWASKSIALRASIVCLFPLLATASPQVSCVLDYNGYEVVIPVRPESDAPQGAWKEMGKFKVRTVLSAPVNKEPWLMVEVYANAANGDFHILSSQKVSAPFATGRIETVEPEQGGNLRYECGEL